MTIDADETTATLTVNTVNDEGDEPNSVVTAEVESGIGYTVGSSSSASVTVEDNDIPPPGTPEVTISAGTDPCDGRDGCDVYDYYIPSAANSTDSECEGD